MLSGLTGPTTPPAKPSEASGVRRDSARQVCLGDSDASLACVVECVAWSRPLSMTPSSGFTKSNRRRHSANHKVSHGRQHNITPQTRCAGSAKTHPPRQSGLGGVAASQRRAATRFAALPSQPELPDPLAAEQNGTLRRIESAEAWAQQREAIKEEFRRWICGTTPPQPENITVEALRETAENHAALAGRPAPDRGRTTCERAWFSAVSRSASTVMFSGCGGVVPEIERRNCSLIASRCCAHASADSMRRSVPFCSAARGSGSSGCEGRAAKSGGSSPLACSHASQAGRRGGCVLADPAHPAAA